MREQLSKSMIPADSRPGYAMPLSIITLQERLKTRLDGLFHATFNFMICNYSSLGRMDAMVAVPDVYPNAVSA
jgi:hypothetical protein